MSKPTKYRFSFGPWNISEGGDPFGPEVRPVFPHEKKFALYKPLGFDGVQFHDDDVVPGLWFDPRMVDGVYSSNSAKDRRYALHRTLRTIDVAREIGCGAIVLW